MPRSAYLLTYAASFALLSEFHQDGSTYAAPIRTVALSGLAAPGTPEGVNFGNFGTFFFDPPLNLVFRGPVINDAGRTAFRANLAGSGVDATSNQGIWSEGSGNLALVARTGNPAPGVPDGVSFGRNPALELFQPVLNDAGQTAFYGGLTDGTVGLWSEGSGSLALVACDGMNAAGAPDGVNHSFELLRDLYTDIPKLNNAGQTSFWANLSGNGVNNTNDWGVWSGISGSLDLVVRSGNPAPGTPDGVKFDSFFFQTGFNDAGQVAFYAFLAGDGVNPSNDNGIWSEGSGTLSLVARTGSQAPGAPAGVTFRDFFVPVEINNAGHTAFHAWLAGDGINETNDEGLFSEGSGELELVARSGSPAPDTPSGVNFGAFSFNVSSWPSLNDAGQITFRGNLTGSGINSTNNLGIWAGENDSLKLVARTGNLAPGTGAGVRFSDLSRPTLNSAGQTAFRAFLTGSGVFSGNNLGIWATDTSGALQLVVRTGTPLEVTPGVIRTISDLAFVTDTGNSDGRASGFNNLGQLVFWARFTDGSQGVFVSSAVAHLPGDFNNDRTVDAADYVVWRKTDGTPTGYDTWRSHFGWTLFTGDGELLSFSQSSLSAVPESTSITLAAVGICALLPRRKRWCNRWRFQRCHRKSFVGTLAIAAAFSGARLTAQATTIEFDASAKSPAEIPFDPTASFNVHGALVSGRIFSNVKGPIVGGTNINDLLGAGAFYSQGYTGTNAVIANIEGGHIWSGHETLQHVLQIPNHPASLNEFDRHATWIGMILGGRRGGANPGAYQDGLAPDAQLYSGAMNSQWSGMRFTTQAGETNNGITFDQFRRAFRTGVNAAGRRADVINASWGTGAGENGSDTTSIAFDGFANADSRTLLVSSAGNYGPGPDTVVSPGSAYNNLSVAALGPNPPYDRPTAFSSGGPNDYTDPINGTKNNARQVVDIAAPGEKISTAYYGGETGGNGTTDNPSVSGTGPTGLPRGSLGGPDYYQRGGLIQGTSISAPIVAGGAALLYDAAYSVFPDNADARDARVMKAVLMNSADKTFGWNNGQVAHPNGNGGVLTTHGLDNRVGTGRLNLDNAYDQFLFGTTDVIDTASGNLGAVEDIGWDFGQVVSGTTNDYYFASPLLGGSTLTGTLTWFRDRRINDSNTVFDDSFDDLNLELWNVVDGNPASLISESSSLYNESEHFSFALPSTGDYALRVRWFKEVFDRVADADQEFYGLAWSTRMTDLLGSTIPEPSSLTMLFAAMIISATARGWASRRQV
jgi:hypothetical protein